MGSAWEILFFSENPRSCFLGKVLLCSHLLSEEEIQEKGSLALTRFGEEFSCLNFMLEIQEKKSHFYFFMSVCFFSLPSLRKNRSILLSLVSGKKLRF